MPCHNKKNHHSLKQKQKNRKKFVRECLRSRLNYQLFTEFFENVLVRIIAVTVGTIRDVII